MSTYSKLNKSTGRLLQIALRACGGAPDRSQPWLGTMKTVGAAFKIEIAARALPVPPGSIGDFDDTRAQAIRAADHGSAVSGDC